LQNKCKTIVENFNGRKRYNVSQGIFMDYIDRLIAMRIDNDLSQRQIALIINKSQQGYDHIEKRRAKLTIEDFMKLCEFYNVRPGYFLGYENKATKLK